MGLSADKLATLAADLETIDRTADTAERNRLIATLTEIGDKMNWAL